MDKLLKKALSKHNLNKFSEARDLYLKIIKKEPSHLDANYLLGTLYAEKGLLAEAKFYLTRAAHIEPNSPMVQTNLGNVYKLQNNLPAAEKCYLLALELKDDLAPAHFGLGTLWDRSEVPYEKVLECYQKAIAFDPGMAEAYLAIGKLLAERSDPAALSYLENAVRLSPRLARTTPELRGLCKWFGISCLKSGKYNEAIENFKIAIKESPEDVELLYYFAIAQKRQPSVDLQRRFIELEFDSFAKRFDQILVDTLGYKTPSLLREMMEGYCGPDLFFKCVADLGCGTGLSGVEFQDHKDMLVGIDISAKMLEKASEKNCYDKLLQGEICQVLNGLDLRFDLFLAADVLVYMGDLTDLFESIILRAPRGAFFAFSTESYGGEGFTLQQTGRYAHSPLYIRSLAKSYSFDVIQEKRVPLRKEWGEWIMGDVYIIKLQ